MEESDLLIVAGVLMLVLILVARTGAGKPTVEQRLEELEEAEFERQLEATIRRVARTQGVAA